MAKRFFTSSLRTVFLSLLLIGALVPKAMAQANVQGEWSTLANLVPINPIHAALLPNGKVLIVAGSGNCPPSMVGVCPAGPPYGPSNGSGAALYDPIAGTFTQFTLPWDNFCNGMALLPDGRALIVGGNLQYDPFYGQSKASIFDPSTNTFTDVENMAHGRWYPTVTTLGDGRAMTFSGKDENGNTNNAVEFYAVGSGWSQQQVANWSPPLYPRMHLLPNGKVFYSGQGRSSALFDPSTATWSLNVATSNFSHSRSYGTSVLLPLTPANLYDPKVMIMGGYSPATATTEIIDLGTTPALWKFGPSMSQPRIQMNAVILPDGKVLAMGGSTNNEGVASASLNADLYDPATNTFSSAGANVRPRLYHSVALLLPDATVWLAGGNPARGSYEHTMELYKPAYLFQPDGTPAPRPSINSAPTFISWGNQFTVQTPDAGNIAAAVLIRNGAVTHAFNMDQRLVGMSFAAGNGVLTLTAPPNGNVAPPGYYMLFLLNNAGVPSVANFVRLGQQSGSATNLALNHPATASTIFSTSYSASAAVDGNTGTRWSSTYSDPQWAYVDLGSTYNINEVKLRWETAYGKAYSIQVSNDAVTWTTIYTTTTGTGGINDLTGLSGSGRYVRMYGTVRGTMWGYSLWEFEVYGTPA